MRSVTILLAILLCMFYPVHLVESAWLIDPERFHISVHGQLSCLECHSDITEKKQHPDVEDVDKTLNAFFRPEQCAKCHKEVLIEINGKGIHGGEAVKENGESNLCIECHNPHYQEFYADSVGQDNNDQTLSPPKVSSEDEACMACHRSIPDDDPKNAEKISILCFHCHAGLPEGDVIKGSQWHPMIDAGEYRSTAHAEISCIKCHSGSLEFSHSDQGLGDCRLCHLPHNEKIAHDAHSDVTCGACHLNEVILVKDREDNKILWRRYAGPRSASKIHQMLLTGDDAFCGRCHFKDNALGSPASALPAKSIICMPCHAATLSVSDALTITALLVFLVGFINIIFIWLSGKRHEGKRVARLYKIIKVIFFDVLLQRRLFRVSRIRWFIHAVIFYPVALRFGWGLVALLSSLWFNQWSWVRIVLDKNHPLTAFLFDVTGMMMIIGLICMILRTKASGLTNRIEGLPKRDWLAYGLLVAILVAGFILEGMRISMTGSPRGSEYAFLGYGISGFFNDAGLTCVYGGVWYLHAILTGVFVAYLPFSRMLHMIIAPISMAINACSRV
jgi:nitrate reductase gamma subunit